MKHKPVKVIREPSLVDRARELAAVVEYSNDAVVGRRLDGTIATWNSAAERIFGYRAEEVLGRKTDLLLPRGLQNEFRQLLTRVSRGEVVEGFETKHRRKDGQLIRVSLTLSPIRNRHGRLAGFSTIARDISEQARAQEALRRSERALTDLFEEASVGLLWTTPQGRIVRANRAFLELIGAGDQQCVGQMLSRFYPDRPLLRDLLKRLAKRETVRNFATLVRSRTGQTKEVLIDASAFREEGRLVHFRWFVRDITRRKQLEREVLAISERERRAFAQELHDSLGQQLSGVAYLVNVLRARLQDQRSGEEPAARRIVHLVKQALEQTRNVARGLSPIGPDPDGLLTALRQLAEHSSEVFGIRCQFRSPRPVWVGDSEAATHLYRIAQEAVHNAHRHGKASHVTIGLSQAGGWVRLTVVDNGGGIGKLSPRRRGLGLHIMQYRAWLLQGRITICRRPAGGTKVICQAPAKVLRAESGTARRSADYESDG